AEFSFRAFATQQVWHSCTVNIRTDNMLAVPNNREPPQLRPTEEYQSDSRMDTRQQTPNNYSDKQLHPEVLKLINKTFGPIQIDLFTTYEQVNKYVSHRAERGEAA